MILDLPGLRPDNLMTYLAGLGMVRIVGAQFDKNATSWWEGLTLRLRCERSGLLEFLVDEYCPTPVLSPWNRGSGYGEKDKTQRVALDKLLGSGAPRMAEFAATNRAFATVTRSADKGAFVQNLRNRVPDAAIPWIDAAVVLTFDAFSGERKPVFPPLLGTGGNDGRYDFSTNFHQRLADVLPELGAKRPASVAWLRAAIDGRSTPLAAATIGQFDPVAAGGPGTSAFDDAGSFVNPWIFVLMVEGLVSFASTPVRRLGEVVGQAAMPFTVNASPAGPVPGSRDENARGELWAPVWSRPLGARDVAHVFSSARASWDGRTATGAAHMYAAVRSSGIDRRADRFFRYGLLERNGQAYSAVLLDAVSVSAQPRVEVGITIEERLRPFLRVGKTNRLAPVFEAYEGARVGFYREPGEVGRLVGLLAAATEVERTSTLTASGRETVSFADRRLSASTALPILSAVLSCSPEYRIAAGLASSKLWIDGSVWSFADLVLGRSSRRGREPFREAVVKGFGELSLVSLLSDLLVWRLAHREDIAAPGSAGVAVMDRFALTIPWQDVHAWAAGSLDDRLVEDALLAMLALDWPEWVEHEVWTPDDTIPIPSLAVVQPFARQAVTVSGFLDLASLRGISPHWPGQLSAGATSRVVEDASAVLRRSSVVQYGPEGAHTLFRLAGEVGPLQPIDGQRLAAALWVPVNSAQALRRVFRLASNTFTEENAS